MSVKRRVIIVVAVLLVLAAAYYAWIKRDQSEHQPLVLYGNVDIRELELAFRQPGRLKSLSFDEGDKVTTGDVMAELDAQPYRDALMAAEAEVQRAHAELGKLRHGNRPEEIAQSLASMHQAEAAFRNADKDFKRQNALVASGSISQRTADAARSVRDQSKAALTAAREALALVREGARVEDIAAGEARLAAAEAAAAQAKTALADTRLVSPADAIVLSRVREPGSMVNTSTAVYTLSLPAPVYVRAYVSEPNLGLVAPGTRVNVTTDSSSKTYQGQIGFVSPRAEFTPKSVETTDLRTALVYRLRIVIDQADESLRQGMPVTISIDSDAPRQ